MTAQRRLIYRIIHESDEHPTAERVYELAKREMPAIGLATVYRNLRLMVEAGEIRHIAVHGSADRYDKTLAPHDHCFCTKCGRVSDLSISGMMDFLKEQTGFTPLSYALNVLCVCDKCKKRMAEASALNCTDPVCAVQK